MRFDAKTLGPMVACAALRVRMAVLRYLRETKAVSTVEYALIVVAVVAIIGAAAATLSGAFEELFNDFGNEIENTLTNVTT
ncbi:MAG: hypothetical protein OXG82_05500 [Gammaproteobacteria bacterium]|nr:hypothetical protein [Gammaproteobacteria bacterium]